MSVLLVEAGTFRSTQVIRTGIIGNGGDRGCGLPWTEIDCNSEIRINTVIGPHKRKDEQGMTITWIFLSWEI